jgi:hypothetical protein
MRRRTMSKLYKLSTELALINDQIIDADGELSTELELRLDALNLALIDKATGIRKWRAQLDSDEAGLDAEIKRLQKMKKTAMNLRDRLEAYIKKNMEFADKQKIETPIGAFTICKNPPSMEILYAEMIPVEYHDIVPQHLELNKERLRKDVLAGKEVPGAKCISDRTHLRVK